MIISNSVNYNRFVSNESGRAVSDMAQAFFQNVLSGIASENEPAGNENSLASYFEPNKPPSSQNCVIDKEKAEARTENDKITETEEQAKDIFTICFECEDKEECEHYRKMIEGSGALEENAVFLPKISNKAFRMNKKNETLLQEQLYKLTGSSIIYNYSIICPDIDTRTKREKR